MVAGPLVVTYPLTGRSPCAAVTAWVALTGHRRVTAGDSVLTQGSGFTGER